MATHGIRRIIVTLLLGAFALLALPLEGSILPTSRKVSAPQDDAAYQALMDAANSVVGIKVKALRNARSNETLGEERTGSGIVISPQGLVLTIGYLILEADTVEIVDSSELTVPGAVVAYDHATGFGLVRPLAPIKTTPIRMGTAKPVSQLDRLMIVTGGEEQTVSIATVVSKRQFAGYWEYPAARSRRCRSRRSSRSASSRATGSTSSTTRSSRRRRASTTAAPRSSTRTASWSAWAPFS
jgi:S1-C subfamily serine protease